MAIIHIHSLQHYSYFSISITIMHQFPWLPRSSFCKKTLKFFYYVKSSPSSHTCPSHHPYTCCPLCPASHASTALRACRAHVPSTPSSLLRLDRYRGYPPRHLQCQPQTTHVASVPTAHATCVVCGWRCRWHV